MSSPYYRVGQRYVDNSTPGTPVEYRCITAGDKTSSVWAKVSGGSSGTPAAGIYGTNGNATAWPVGSIVVVLAQITVASVVIQPGFYIALTGVPMGGTGLQIPQFPYPTGSTPYWYLIAPLVLPVNICTPSGTSQIYIPSTASF
jgi:hypothetical protein